MKLFSVISFDMEQINTIISNTINEIGLISDGQWNIMINFGTIFGIS